MAKSAHKYFKLQANNLGAKIQTLDECGVFPLTLMGKAVTLYCGVSSEVTTFFVHDIQYDDYDGEITVGDSSENEYAICSDCKWFANPEPDNHIQPPSLSELLDP